MLTVAVFGVLLGAALILIGAWAAVYNDGPRFAAGFGSGYTPGTRRFMGIATVVLGVLLIVTSAG